MDHEVERLVRCAQRANAEGWRHNRFLDLLEDGAVPVEHLGHLAGELYRLVGSDRRSFALLAARFAAPPAGDLYLALAEGQGQAMRLLLDYAEAVDLDEQRLRTHDPRPLAQAYPAYLTQVALFGGQSAVALALLANVTESGATYARVAEALRARYGLTEAAVGHFRFFAETPLDLLDLAAATVDSGLSQGEDPDAAVLTARMVAAYERAFWAALAEGLA